MERYPASHLYVRKVFIKLKYLTILSVCRDSAEWEFVFRRNVDWVCKWQDDWGDSVFDAEHLAKMPEK